MSNKLSGDSSVFSISDAAKHLGVSDRSIWRKIKSGILEKVTLDGKTYVRVPDAMTTDVTQPKNRAKRTDMADMERQAIISRQEEEISYLRDQNKALLILNNKLADQLSEVTRMLPAPSVTQPEEKPQTEGNNSKQKSRWWPFIR